MVHCIVPIPIEMSDKNVKRKKMTKLTKYLCSAEAQIKKSMAKHFVRYYNFQGNIKVNDVRIIYLPAGGKLIK